MSDNLVHKKTVTLEELALSSMWEMAALMDLLEEEEEDLLTRQVFLTKIQEI